jgi:hypothetical protein
MSAATRPKSKSFASTLRAALCAMTLITGGCRNLFEDLSTKNTNDAYFADAKTAINDRDYSLALTKLLATTPEYQAKREVILTIAGAYAGRCGLDFLKVVRGIIDAPTVRLFPLLVSNFKGATTGSIDDCDSAQTWVLKLAPARDFSGLSADENLFVAVTSLAKIGAILGTYADLDRDGVADSSFDACNTVKLPAARTRDLGVDLNLILASLAASGNTQLTGSTAGVAAVCAALPAGQNFCGIYDPAGFSPAMLQLLGGLIGSRDAVGLGTCADTFPNCVCP